MPARLVIVTAILVIGPTRGPALLPGPVPAGGDCAWALPMQSMTRSSAAARIFGACLVAKRLECVELAPAFVAPGCSGAGASSPHSNRSARLGCDCAALLFMASLGLRRGLECPRGARGYRLAVTQCCSSERPIVAGQPA